jgi:hypothetical protein
VIGEHEMSLKVFEGGHKTDCFETSKGITTVPFDGSTLVMVSPQPIYCFW